jgi:uncharacterized protein (TIGR02145 family)
MKNIILLIIMLLGFSIYAQKVTNVSNRQEQSTIIISYNLETKTPCKIALYLSTNGGTTWHGPLKKVSGDVGVNVSSGSKSITWNVLEEFEELKGDDIIFKVSADAISLLESIKIGKQEWTKKNLSVRTYSDGTPIPEVSNPTQWKNLTTGAWCFYDNDPKNGSVYGILYNWYAVAGIYDVESLANPALRKKLAPSGWHIPSDAEWTHLIDCLGGELVAGGKMKSIGTSLWGSPNIAATNESGFKGLPAGYRDFRGIFGTIGGYGSWWSSSEDDETGAWGKSLNFVSRNALKTLGNKKEGYSVRCIKDK